MSPVDSIQPPKKTSKSRQGAIQATAKPKKKSPVRTEKPVPQITKSTAPSQQPPEQKAASPKHTANRERLMWILAGAVLVVVVILWALALPGMTSDNNKGFGFFLKTEEKINNLWDSIKEDLLKIESQLKETAANQNTNSAEEQAERLEQEIFPQFEDPTKQ